MTVGDDIPAPGRLREILLTHDTGAPDRFERQPDGTWHLICLGIRVTGYDMDEILRVMRNRLEAT